MPKFQKHIFVCGNQRPPGSPRGCCDPSGQARLQKIFKQKLVERADVDEIIESHIIGGKPVKRLLLADECLNTQACKHRKPSGQ